MGKPLIDGRRWDKARTGIEQAAGEIQEGLQTLLGDKADPVVIARSGLALNRLLQHLKEMDNIADEWKGQ